MNLDLDLVAKIFGLILATSSVVGVVGIAVAAIMAPRMQKAISAHSDSCGYRKALDSEVARIARALDDERQTRKEGDDRIERAVTHITDKLDDVHRVLLSLASGRSA